MEEEKRAYQVTLDSAMAEAFERLCLLQDRSAASMIRMLIKEAVEKSRAVSGA